MPNTIIETTLRRDTVGHLNKLQENSGVFALAQIRRSLEKSHQFKTLLSGKATCQGVHRGYGKKESQIIICFRTIGERN